ncbi:MAG: transcriptional regulator [Pricia sp.]
MTKRALEAKKERLIERLGVYIECRDQMAPVAARIVSTLILTGKKGMTFDELVENLSASKSTISTHVNYLQQVDRITYFTKPGDRKKYFVMNPNAMIHVLDKMMENWERERNLHVEIMDYKKEINATLDEGDDSKFELEFHREYLNFFEQVSASMARIKAKLIGEEK